MRGGNNFKNDVMKDIEKRLAAVEAENVALKAELAALQLLLPANKPALPQRAAPQVRVTNPLPRVALPNEEQCRQLCEIVFDRYPSLRPRRGEEEEFAAEFRAAMRFVEHHGRRAAPDHGLGVGWWIDTARVWLSQHAGGNSLVGGNAFVAAIVAAGDVPYSDPGEPGFAIGLQHTGGGIEASARWHTVLATRRLLDPAPPERPKPVFSPVSVAGGR